MFSEARGTRLAGRVCVVTGGGSGIGRAICLAFGREGATVVAADKNAESAARTVGELEFLGARGMAVQVDVSVANSVRGMVDVTLQEQGRIDVLVNNAGFGFAATVVETEEADWDRLMSVNLKGVYLGCKYVVPVMVRQGGGSIVNTASAAGLVGVADRAAYCASKGGVIAMTRAPRRRWCQDQLRRPWHGRVPVLRRDLRRKRGPCGPQTDDGGAPSHGKAGDP